MSETAASLLRILGGRNSVAVQSCRSVPLLLSHCRCLSQPSDRAPHSRGGGRRARFLRNKTLRANRRSPELERAARSEKLLVPLKEVHLEWQSHQGRRHLQNAGLHFNIYKDIFGTLFLPQGFMGVVYADTHHVHRGNIISAAHAVHLPEVTLPPGLPRGELCSLLLTNPDGHLTSNTSEILHWMLSNISSGDISSGETVCPYLPPVPPQGTGFHRFVFTLLTHSTPLQNLGLCRGRTWLEQRTFSTQEFLAASPGLEAFTFSFFQTQWDQSVHTTYTKTLGCPEPVYGLEKETTPRKRKQQAVRENRANRYRNMM